MFRRTLLAAFALLTPLAVAQPPRMRFDPDRIHDPSTVVHQGEAYRLFATGPGLPLFEETTDAKWKPVGRLFADDAFPRWHRERIPENRGTLWAPDLIRIGEQYLLYYSVSSFGKQRSAIGLAVGPTVDPQSPDWRWEDRGVVIESREGDPYNTIDPALFRDPRDERLWMVFGSYWQGIHLVELDPATGLRRDGAPPVRLAWKEQIEAAAILEHGGEYYLLVNWGHCCRGVASTYEIRVGRSRTVTGPYVDRDGIDLREGGGTPLLATEGKWIGPGHPSLLVREGREWLPHHYYNRDLDGRARLRIVPLSWDLAGWPTVEE